MEMLAGNVPKNERNTALHSFDRRHGDVGCLVVSTCLLILVSGCAGHLSRTAPDKTLPITPTNFVPALQPVALRHDDGGKRYTDADTPQDTARHPQPDSLQSMDAQHSLSSESVPRLHVRSIAFHAPVADGEALRFGISPESQPSSGRSSVVTRIAADYGNFYSKESLTMLAGGAAVAATLAYAPIDEPLRNYYQRELRSERTNSASSVFEPLGNGLYTLPVMFGTWAFGEWIDGRAEGGISEWGERSSRAMLVGAPAMLALQVMTGGSRPNESEHGAQWRPFQDSNGVSGHAFMGAVPFLSLAHMADDAWLRSGLYAASTLTGITRINDDAHYLSQVVFGWWVAYLATTSVEQTYLAERNLRIYPFPVEDGVGVGFEISY